jgi:hypothetical protein
MILSQMLPMPLSICPNLHPHLMRMDLSTPSKPNLFPSRLELQINLLRHPLPVRPHSPLPPPKLKSLKVNFIHSFTSQQSKGKKKTKNKPKKNNNNEQPKNQSPVPATETQPQRKPKFPCLIYGDDHYTRDYPHRNEVEMFFKGNSQPVVLTQPFP